MILSITHSQKIKPLLLDLGKLIPMLLLVCSGSASGQVLPCDSLSTDASWEIVGVAPSAVFCTSTAIELIVRTDSTYNEDFLSYQWQRKEGAGNFVNIAGATNDTLNTTLTATAQFQCVVTCFNGDTGDDRTVGPITLTITLPTAGAISGAQTICNGGDPAVINNQTAGTSATSINVSYQWQSRIGTGQFTDIETNGNQQTYNPPANLTVTTSYQRLTKSSDPINAECFSAPTNTVTVEVQGVISPGTITISGNDTICSGTNASNITGNAVTASDDATIAYVWEQSTNNITFTEISGAVAASFDPTTNLTQNTFYRRYTESILNGVTCASAPTASVQVTVRVLPTPGSISGSDTICYQGDPLPFTSSTAGTANDGGAISYRWEVNTNSPGFPAGSWTNPTTGTGATTAIFEEASNILTSNRQYRRFAISTLSGSPCTSAAATGTVQLTVLPQLTASFEQNTATVCVGETAELRVNGTPGAIVRYTVTGVSGNRFVELLDGTGVITVDNTTAAGPLTVNLNQIQIQITSSVTCTSTLNVGGTVTVIALPTASFSAGNSSTHCLASTYTLNLSGTPNSTIYYTLNDGQFENVTLQSSNNASVSGITLILGLNTFRIDSVSLGNCTNTNIPFPQNTFAVLVTQNPSVSVVATNGDDFLLCPGESVTLRSNTDGTAYQWFRGGVQVGDDPEYVATELGNYSVAVTSGGCGGTSPEITLAPAQVPVANITADEPTTFCDGGSVSISSTVNSCVDCNSCLGCELLWSNESAATSSSITVSDNETITLTVTNLDGCSVTSDTITVIENPLPNVGINASANTICDGATAELEATGATSYSWINVDSGQSAGNGAVITVGVSGVYRVTGTTTTSGVACSNTDEEEIVVLATPELNSITGPTAVCANSSAEIVLQGTDDAVVSYRINGGILQTDTLDGNGEAVLNTDPDFDGNSLVYTLVSILLGDCPGTVSGSVSIQVNPRPVMTQIPNSTYCNNIQIDEIDLTANVNNASFSWLSSGLFIADNNLPNNTISGRVVLSGQGNATDTSFFQVWATDLQNCVSDTVSFQLEITPGPQFITPFEDAAFCDGETWPGLTLQTDVEDVAYSYAIEGDFIGITEPTNPVFPSVELSYPVSGDGSRTNTITVTATTPEGCETENTLEVTVVSRPTMSTLLEQAFCEGEAATVLFSGAEGYQYDWQLLSDNLLGLQTTSESNSDDRIEFNAPDVVDEINVSIQVTPKYTNGQLTCPGSSETVIVFINPRPTLIIQPPIPFCANDSVLDEDFMFSFTPDNHVSYRWEVANADAEFFTLDSGDGPIATETINANLTQTISDIQFIPLYTNHGIACEGNAQTVAATILPLPSVNVSGSFDTVALCSGEHAIVNIQNQTSPASTWNVIAQIENGVENVTGSCANCDIDDILTTSNSPGTVTYSIIPEIASGECLGTPQTRTFQVNPLPLAPQVISDESSTWCAGAQGVILLADTTADVVRYDWTSIPDEWNPTYGGTINAIDGGQIYLDVPAAGGTINYTLTATNEYQCSTSGNFSLTVDAGTSLPDYDVVIVNQGTGNEMLAVIPAIDGQTYQWGVLNQSDWSSSTLNGETAQVLFLDASFDPEAQYYYVDVTNGDCVSRVFFNSPNTLIPQSISEEMEAIDMQLFPNPFSNQLQLTKANYSVATQLTIVDVMGRTVHSAELPAYQVNYTIDTNYWAAGTYFLKAISGNTLVSTTLIKL